MSSKTPSRGRLVVISAPSGSGKTTVIHALLKNYPWTVRSISMTTRLPRAGEKPGRDYHFVRPQQFEQARAKRQFLEWARVLGHAYGTPRRAVIKAATQGKDVLLGIDIQGAYQIRRSGFPSTLIFLLPPSWKALEERLKRRGTETPRQIRTRLKLARKEMQHVKNFDYAVVNDRLKDAVRAIGSILQAQRYKVGEK